MVKRIVASILVLLVVAALLVGIFGFKMFINKKISYALSHRPIPPVSVSTAKVATAQWANQLESVGTFTAVQGVNVTAQIAGNVTSIKFKSGQMVKAGQPLVTVDDTTQRAQVKLDESALALAQTNLRRTQNLIRHSATSQAQLDTDKAAVQTAKAQVAKDEADLQKLDIVAPFTGQLGIRQVSLGQYLSTGTPIVSLNAYKPIYLDFYVPQGELGQVKLGQSVQASVDAYPGRVFSGKLVSQASAVDVASRNIQLRAELPNKSGLLRPGMFAHVALFTGKTHTVLVVPSTAIAYNTYGDYVAVITHATVGGKSVLGFKQASVKPGAQRDGVVSVASGLKAGEEVITAGQLKLYPGASLVINNKIHP
ncbi:MAG: efflux RND transporter periplasmic adaptor subunit [Phycisphaerales bacterium]|nr:efflux RND transporter periplasmic adaptor subunit [Phycisphaerales bacterium]